jgi:hypothetical protein
MSTEAGGDTPRIRLHNASLEGYDASAFATIRLITAGGWFLREGSSWELEPALHGRADNGSVSSVAMTL